MRGRKHKGGEGQGGGRKRSGGEERMAGRGEGERHHSVVAVTTATRQGREAVGARVVDGTGHTVWERVIGERWRQRLAAAARKELERPAVWVEVLRLSEVPRLEKQGRTVAAALEAGGARAEAARRGGG